MPRLFAGKSLVPTLAALFAIALFCGLGFWQLQRADEKRALQEEYDRRASEPAIVLSPTVRSPSELQFFRVQATGVYDDGYQLLLDNRSHHGAPGYHVVTPLRIDGGDTRVLVNRGWIALGTDRAHPPSAEPPRGQVTVSGVAVVPKEGFYLGDLDPLQAEGPTVWQQLDLARYAKERSIALQPVVILLDPANSAGGYLREWARLDTGIAVHQGYAFQWFVLAAGVVVLYSVLSLRARWGRKDGGGK